MKTVLLLMTSCTLAASAFAAPSVDDCSTPATDSITPATSIQRLYAADLVAWLQGATDHTVYEGNHQGRWSEGDQLIFSIDGQSYRQNRYYLDGFRINDRFASGSTLYPTLYDNHSVEVDPAATALRFASRDAADHVQLTANAGGLGGINPTTEGIIHLFHGTGTEGLYRHDDNRHRQHVRGAASLRALLHSRHGQHELLASYGNRRLPQYDQDGLLTEHPLYGAQHFKLQAIGRIATRGYFHHVGYLANVSGKEDGFSEFYYNRQEQPRLATYSASVYGNHDDHRTTLATGLTWATTTFRHDDAGFAKNLIDQDGESLEPWMPDGRMHELSWSADYARRLTTAAPVRLTLKGKAYNSLIGHHAESRTWTNVVYLQHVGAASATPLIRYDWQSRSFAGALLENEVVLQAEGHGRDAACFSYGATLGMSLDGMLLRTNSKVTPNLVASLSCRWRPWQWLEVSGRLYHDRMTYDIETLRYMSTRYMNADIKALSANDVNASAGTLLTRSGGRYHRYARRLWQPSFVGIEIPIVARFGRHEVALIQGYRKFYHTWLTQYEGGATANGYFVDTPLTAEMLADEHVATDGPLPTLPLYYLHPGEHSYEVGYMPEGLMGKGPLTATPYYMSQLTRYTYHGRKVEASVGWQSMMGVGYCGLGNGPGSNNVGVLSESTANPNTFLVIKNSQLDGTKGRYPTAGRYDQDRAYVCRLLLAYNLSRHVQLGAMGSWTDGQPFTYYRIFTNTADGSVTSGAASPTQVAIVPGCSRGINPTDGNFGCRESAIFHIDLHARFRWTMQGHDAELHVQSYNVYDFGNVLNEFCFPQGYCEGRGPNMCLTIPRGLIASFTLNL